MALEPETGDLVMLRERKLKVSYRATFRQPIGILNQMGLKCSATIPVEIRRKAALGLWIACAPGDRTPSGIMQDITGQPSSEAAQSQMRMYFQERVSSWEVWLDGPLQKRLEPCEYYVRDGQVYAAKTEQSA